jgi:hypothetical protein
MGASTSKSNPRNGQGQGQGQGQGSLLSVDENVNTLHEIMEAYNTNDVTQLTELVKRVHKTGVSGDQLDIDQSTIAAIAKSHANVINAISANNPIGTDTQSLISSDEELSKQLK